MRAGLGPAAAEVCAVILYAGAVVWVRRLAWVGGVSAAAAVLAGCFRGQFLDDTCDRRPEGCDAATTTGTTGAVPTTGMTTTDSETDSDSTPVTTETTSDMGPDLPGIPVSGLPWRIDTVRIVDPPLYVNFGDCLPVKELVNAAIQEEVDTYGVNLFLVAPNYSATAPVQEFLFYREAICPEPDANTDTDTDAEPPPERHCFVSQLDSPTAFNSANKDDGNCGAVDITTLNPATLGELNLPNSPCVLSPTASLTLTLTPDLSPLPFFLAQFAAQYIPDRSDPTGLTKGLLYGFIKRSDAENLVYNYLGIEVTMWQTIHGSDHPDACPIPDGGVSDVDWVDFGGNEGLVEGVFMYFNFTASRVALYHEPP